MNFNRVLYIILILILLIAASQAIKSQEQKDQDLLTLAHDGIRLRADLSEMVANWISSGEWARPCGSIYTVDIGHLMIYAALTGNRNLYDPLREFTVEHLILDNPSDPYTRGFVLWRYNPGFEPDASGTTEALRIAEGLWLGGNTFSQLKDIELSLMVLDGYARHAYVDQGVWMIRNYFNLGTRAFANNSFLVDLDPDFISLVAEATGNEELQKVANLSYEQIQDAVTPAGLLYDIIQPEILTLVPELSVYIFSPNDIIQISNAYTVAERAVRKRPEIGQNMLHFFRERHPEVHRYYFGSSGMPAHSREANLELFTSVVRLAVYLEDHEVFAMAFSKMVNRGQAFAKNVWEPKLYTTGEILLALHYGLEWIKTW